MNEVLVAFVVSAAVLFSSCAPSDSITIEVKTNEAPSNIEESSRPAPDKMQYALDESIETVRKTDECIKAWLEKSSRYPALSVQARHILSTQLEICESEYDRIKAIRERHSEFEIGKDAADCLTLAQLIAGYRAKALWSAKAMEIPRKIQIRLRLLTQTKKALPRGRVIC